jgi:hypothetical protein
MDHRISGALEKGDHARLGLFRSTSAAFEIPLFARASFPEKLLQLFGK